MSFLRHLYYEFKPYLPQSARMAFRRGMARRMLRRSTDIWPINPIAGAQPPEWRGWPDKKRFALVLTHDIEGAKGLENCRELADLESSLGFRSSFNFIPEGAYTTPESLRTDLTRNGFEVGVHDLRHDGKLYRSRSDFRAAARKINGYLKQWGAVGFRSGFMHHNLDWLHDLEIAYDMSTFDTDPFEPQPDGVSTIFPFPVQGPGLKGYIEMPYTLPQDSTLFLVLEQKDISIWKQKLKWIAQHGGMALLNVHPDYLSFSESSSRAQYPARFYSEFLTHAKETYGDAYWLALPREVAGHIQSALVDCNVLNSNARESALRLAD